MSLSCSCDYDQEFEPGDWTYVLENNYDFTILNTTRRKRCCSCGELISIGATCIEYYRARYPYDDIESRIKNGCDCEDSFDDEPTIHIASHYHCEKCAEIYLNLTDIGYECLSPNENMIESLKEYHELTGFKANKALETTPNNRRISA